jgi:hypothetical protein
MRHARRLLVLVAVCFVAAISAVVVAPPDMDALGAALFAPSETRTVTSSVPAFEVKQAGGGIAMRAEITNPNSAAIALDGVNSGTGHGLLAWNLGLGRGAVVITSNAANPVPAMEVSSQSLNSALEVRANNTANTKQALLVQNLGTGPSALLTNLNDGDLAIAQALSPRGGPTNYPPGTVVEVSTLENREVRKSQAAYSKRVMGVVVGQAGLLLTDQGSASTVVPRVAVATSGIVMTRVTAANGRIARGSLLVASRTKGVAMRGSDSSRMLGAIIGKALAPHSGSGTRLIPVLVTLG